MDARVPTTLSLAFFAQLVFPQFSTAQYEPLFTCTQVSTSTLLLKAVSKRYFMTGSEHPDLRGEPARPAVRQAKRARQDEEMQVFLPPHGN